jgi:hypothetical protein
MWNWNKKQPATTLHEQILAGNVGCLFAKEAAERGEIAYATVDAGHNSNEEGVQNALQGYIDDDRKRVLMLLSSHEPMHFEKGRGQALQIYEHMVLALRTINQHALIKALEINEDLNIFAAHQVIPALNLLPRELQTLMRDPVTRDRLCDTYAANGALSQKFVDSQTGEVRRLFSFAMAPYYEPVTNMPHPRWAPHFCVAVTEQRDINTAIKERPLDVTRTQQWEVAAAGQRYPQGFHPRAK